MTGSDSFLACPLLPDGFRLSVCLSVRHTSVLCSQENGVIKWLLFF